MLGPAFGPWRSWGAGYEHPGSCERRPAPGQGAVNAFESFVKQLATSLEAIQATLGTPMATDPQMRCPAEQLRAVPPQVAVDKAEAELPPKSP